MLRRTAVAAALFAALMGIPVPAQRPPSPRVVGVTPASARRPAEVAVAINPTNADHVITVLMAAGAPGQPRVGNHAHVSVEGGVTLVGAGHRQPRRRRRAQFSSTSRWACGRSSAVRRAASSATTMALTPTAAGSSQPSRCWALRRRRAATNAP